ncbi:MAG: DNA cytosine methyltransferase [Candidatus Eremiobacteraeota bacterium]|uniref:DNA (cytosine-5-)-methyltransferase n=1 Tax=mine drainage metagenome TaxID=410659 RepID=E6Q1M7_9ZZZZ|nr:DNA cytosine methyltransferase [Candidatus Eremiobacteraeota bacterium]
MAARKREIRKVDQPVYTVADLFAGAGGLTQGFQSAGYRPVAAVEFDRWAARTYSINFGPHVLACPIEEVEIARSSRGLAWSGQNVEGVAVKLDTPEIDVLVGGPPCQGFSPLGRMNDWSFDDPRNGLWRHYMRVLDILNPKVFVIENVPEILKSQEFERLKRYVKKLGRGYQLTFGVLNASFFGVPQNRKRAIIIGSRISHATLPPETFDRCTVRDAIGDLTAEPTGHHLHVGRNPQARSLERYKCVPEGGNRFDLMRLRPDLAPKCWLQKKTGSTDVFGRMRWDEPAPTIRTEFFKPEKGRYLHPVAHRPITLREAARLQTFPDEFEFSGSHVQIAKQIGNAVPVRLAYRIALHIRTMLLPDGTQAERKKGEIGVAS